MNVTHRSCSLDHLGLLPDFGTRVIQGVTRCVRAGLNDIYKHQGQSGHGIPCI